MQIRSVGARVAVVGLAALVSCGADEESVRIRVPPEATRGVALTATVELPRWATRFARLEDDTSQLSIRFALVGANGAPIAVADGMALYAGALPGADVVHRVHAEGTEDFVVFEERPAREELFYTVDVSRVAGVRLVSNTLEFLDDAGTPRLRIAPPYVVDAGGERHEASLAVEGCAYDMNPAAPWGRPVTSPGAALCTVRVAWAGVAYPAVVDPAWTATGSMAQERYEHTASMLESGEVLVAGGGGAKAELYDPATGTFSATGSMAEPRSEHTASVLGSGEVLVAGGYSATAELYDPATGTFSPTGAMAVVRHGHTASVLGSGKVLLAGGYGFGTAELYDPAAGTFSATGAMMLARTSHTASVLASGDVLIAGGHHPKSGNSTIATELYDPATETFSTAGSMTEPRSAHTASVLGMGKVLVAGGWSNCSMKSPCSPSASAELYDPAAGTFSAAKSMAEARSAHTASVLPSGGVLVAGGAGGPTSELYDPAGGMFSGIIPMVQARSGHTASVLASGKVLVAGGSGFASAETFDLGGTGGTGGAGGAGGSDQGGAAPAGGASQGGGGTGTSTSTSTSEASPSAHPYQADGCGCHLEGSAPAGAGWLGALGALAIVATRRRPRISWI